MSLQLITILWMCGEAAIALFAARRAHSGALLGFGADSGIELVSALVVLLSFKRVAHINEKKPLESPACCSSPWPRLSSAAQFWHLGIYISDHNPAT